MVLRKAVWIAILLNVLVLLLYLYNGLMVLIAFDGSMPITTLISTIGIVPVAITLAALSKLDE